MGTIVEGSLDDVLDVIEACHSRVREMDDRKNAGDEMRRKVQSVERELKAASR